MTPISCSGDLDIWLHTVFGRTMMHKCINSGDVKIKMVSFHVYGRTYIADKQINSNLYSTEY